MFDFPVAPAQLQGIFFSILEFFVRVMMRQKRNTYPKKTVFQSNFPENSEISGNFLKHLVHFYIF